MDSQDEDRIEQIPPAGESSATEVAPTGDSSAVEPGARPLSSLEVLCLRRGFKVLQNVEDPNIYSIDWNDPMSAFDKSHIPTGYLPGTPRGPYFRSRRIVKGEADRSYLKPTPRMKYANGIVYFCVLVGCTLAGILVWDGYRQIAQHKYCEVFHDNFTTWDPSVWTKEVEVGGFG
jgi:hypothetical protein